MNNYKLTIQYDGTNYAGWQIQKNAMTVQQKITDALNILLKEKVSLIGSGRTDAGVHALGQVANFKTKNAPDLFLFQHSLNGILPKDISVVHIAPVPENFNSRFDANRRIYLYVISKTKSPFLFNYSYFYPKQFHINQLNYLSTALIGTNDFTGLSRKNSKLENKNCTIYSARWRNIKDIIIFRIEADRYLHGMVRIITATLIKTQKLNLGIEYIEKILIEKDSSLAAGAAPAKGLFLYKVNYD